MIEEILINQGVAGAMLIYFIYDKVAFQRDIIKLINNNTIAMTKVYENLRKIDKDLNKKN
ncbi:MAG: hypothetical protein ACOC5T_02965 [Elusimicrobiota bacterium]